MVTVQTIRHLKGDAKHPLNYCSFPTFRVGTHHSFEKFVGMEHLWSKKNDECSVSQCSSVGVCKDVECARPSIECAVRLQV